MHPSGDEDDGTDTIADAMEYMRAKTVDLPKKFLGRGRI